MPDLLAAVTAELERLHRADDAIRHKIEVLEQVLRACGLSNSWHSNNRKNVETCRQQNDSERIRTNRRPARTIAPIPPNDSIVQRIEQFAMGLPASPQSPWRAEPAQDSRKTQFEMVQDVLRERGGMEAMELAFAIHEKFGVEVPQPSLSAQLSKWRSKGRVTLEGRLWYLAERPSDLAPPEDRASIE